MSAAALFANRLTMKTTLLILSGIIFCAGSAVGQTPETTDHIIEGSKIIVELVKALSNKKDSAKDPGCKGNYADLCIENTSTNSITVMLEHRDSAEKREVVILPKGKECSLQAMVGVWTYDLSITGTQASFRKGDMRIEGCNNLNMNIK